MGFDLKTSAKIFIEVMWWQNEKEREKKRHDSHQLNIMSTAACVSQLTQESQDSIYWKAITALAFMRFFNFLRLLSGKIFTEFFRIENSSRTANIYKRLFTKAINLLITYVSFRLRRFQIYFLLDKLPKCVNRFSLRALTLTRASSASKENLRN